MKSKTVFGALLLSVALCSQGFGCELLDRCGAELRWLRRVQCLRQGRLLRTGLRSAVLPAARLL